MDQARTSCVQKTRPPRPSAGASRPPSLRAQQPGGTRHDSLDRNPHPAQGPQAPAGHVAGAMDALGRVTEGQSPRPDPNLAPAYLALMPLRASAVRVRRGRTPRPSPGYAGYATRKAPPSPEQAGKGAVGQSTAPRHWQSVPLRHSDGRAATRCRTRHRALHVERTAVGPALRVGPGRLSHKGVGRNAQARTRDLMVGRRWGRWGEVGGWAGSHIRARSGAPPSKLAPRCQRDPALGGELRVPMARLERMPAARAKAELPDGSLGRWTGAEGSGPRCPSLHR